MSLKTINQSQVQKALKSYNRGSYQKNFIQEKQQRFNLVQRNQAETWSPNIDLDSIAPNLFGASLFPYLAFLYFLKKSEKTPPGIYFGFQFLLVFVFVTIPAGIISKVKYGTSLSNVDFLHGSAESFLLITNLLIVLGVRNAIKDKSKGQDSQQESQQAPDK